MHIPNYVIPRIPRVLRRMLQLIADSVVHAPLGYVVM